VGEEGVTEREREIEMDGLREGMEERGSEKDRHGREGDI
jgi:hypothetical protein